MRIDESRLRRIIKEEINNVRDNIIYESSLHHQSTYSIKNMTGMIKQESREGQTDRAFEIIADAIHHLAVHIEKINKSK